jgi:hypothetical protein
MPAPIADPVLDSILAVQLLVAWAGEGRCEPRRLGWWDTDLIDEAGGGDFLARLAPQTHAWAALEAVREAARRVDAKARAKMAGPDKMRTLFFLGFEIDERLSDRLTAHKVERRSPADALRFALPISGRAAFSRDAFAKALDVGDASFAVVPGGRQLSGVRPSAPDVLVGRLAAALVPLADTYPLPFYRLDSSGSGGAAPIED